MYLYSSDLPILLHQMPDKLQIFFDFFNDLSNDRKDDKVEVGDVIISIDNVLVFDISPEFIAKMIKKLGGRVPISLAIAKARRRTKFAEVYPSFVPYLRYCGLEIDNLQKKWVQQDKWNRWRPGR